MKHFLLLSHCQILSLAVTNYVFCVYLEFNARHEIKHENHTVVTLSQFCIGNSSLRFNLLCKYLFFPIQAPFKTFIITGNIFRVQVNGKSISKTNKVNVTFFVSYD